MKYCTKCGKELFDNETCDCIEVIDNKNVFNNITSNEQASLTGCIITAIVYPLIFIIISLIIYSIDETSMFGLIIAIIANICSGIFILLGGFSVLIIPLPYITIGKVKCLKSYLPTYKKILYGVLAIILLLSTFPILYFLNNV